MAVEIAASIVSASRTLLTALAERRRFARRSNLFTMLACVYDCGGEATMQTIDEQQVLQNLAYQAWLERGQPFGSPEVDWQRAQQLLQLYRQDINAQATVVGGIPELTDVAIAGKPEKKPRPKHSRARNAA